MNKKSLINTIKATKKANVAKEALGATTTTSVKSPSLVMSGKKRFLSTKMQKSASKKIY